MSVLGLMAVGGAAATFITSVGAARNRQVPARPILKFVIPAALATLLLTPALIRGVPVLGLALACLPGFLAYRAAVKYSAVTYPRAVTAGLLESRLKSVIGEAWSRRAMGVNYESASSGEAEDVCEVIVQLPRNVLPSRVSEQCRTVLTETLGRKWTGSVKGTLLTFVPKVEVEDPKALKHIKTVLLDRSGLGVDGTIEVNIWDEDGEISEWTGRASSSMGNLIAKRERQQEIERTVQARIPIANGSWAFSWDVTDVPTVVVRRSAFRDIIYLPVPEHFVTSREEAAALYPKMSFGIGVYPDGRICTRTPVKEPNGITTGSTGKGKTTHLHVECVQFTAWGGIVIVLDGKFSDSFIGFMDWPGMQIVANDMYSAIRVIYFVAEMLSRRQEGGRSGDFPIDDNLPVLFIVDEYQDFVKRLQTEVWDIYKGDEDGPNTCPAITLLERFPQMIRQFRIHMDTGTQKPEAGNISANIVFNSDKKSQWGQMTGAQSNAFWGEYNIGPSVPPIAGRGLMKTLEGDPEYVQGYYVPDPAKAKTREDFELLAKLMPPVTLHKRIVFEMPDPEIATWEDITKAPWHFAEDRPDLDPLSPDYNPPAFIKYNTFRDLNPATMDVESAQSAKGNSGNVIDLDRINN